VTIGSNSQPVAVQLDTGSIELWVNPNCSASQIPSYCDSLPRYDPTTSTSAVEHPNDVFQVTYGSGSVGGKYYEDTVAAGPAFVAAQPFGVADKSAIVPFGILGIGPIYPEWLGYNAFIYGLAAKHTIAKAAFSLDLRSIGDPSGKCAVHRRRLILLTISA
jgi:hypothetical protein